MVFLRQYSLMDIFNGTYFCQVQNLTAITELLCFYNEFYSVCINVDGLYWRATY